MSPSGDPIQFHASVFVGPTAILLSTVVVRENVFIEPDALIRADEIDFQRRMQLIVIGAQSKIWDGVISSSRAGAAANIGERSSIAHRAVVHGPCEAGYGVFIGFNSGLFNCRGGAG